jgi:hypothetical protein
VDEASLVQNSFARTAFLVQHSLFATVRPHTTLDSRVDSNKNSVLGCLKNMSIARGQALGKGTLLKAKKIQTIESSVMSHTDVGHQLLHIWLSQC